MSERDTQIDRDVDVGLDETGESTLGERSRDSTLGDVGLGEPSRDTESVSRESAPSREHTQESDSWLRRKLGGVVSSRSVLVALALSVVGAIAFGTIPFIGLLGNLLGVAAAGFVYGLGSGTRRYFEMALAGALAGGGAAVLGNVVLAVLVTGGTLILFGAVVGALAGATGHYFGRDLRKGLTQDLGEPP
jgi:hypothetical protein